MALHKKRMALFRDTFRKQDHESKFVVYSTQQQNCKYSTFNIVKFTQRSCKIHWEDQQQFQFENFVAMLKHNQNHSLIDEVLVSN